MSIYREEIIDHYRNPRNKGELENPDASSHDSNPLCGDVLNIKLKISDNNISDVKFTGSGCAISQSAISMLTEKLIGMDIEEANKIDRDYIVKMLGIEISPARIKCALLSLKVLKLAILDYKAKK